MSVELPNFAKKLKKETNPEQFNNPISSTDAKVSAFAGSKIGALFTGLYKSKLVKAIAFVAITVGAVAAFATLPGWVLAAVAVGALAIGLLVQLGSSKERQKLSFEISNFFDRLFAGKNYNEITGQDGVRRLHPEFKLWLGALPNRLRKDGEELDSEKGVTAVLSMNEPWEREPLGLSLPYPAHTWRALGVSNYHKIDVKDHVLVPNENLDQAADHINKMRKEGCTSMYVHCRAGKTRSAMAIAAYLIKYENMTAEQACNIIAKSRPKATIQHRQNELQHLKGYEKHVKPGSA